MVLPVIEIVILAGLLVTSGFFSGSETALFSLSKVQKEKIIARNPSRGKLIVALLDRPRALIITILLGNEFVNVCFSSLFSLFIIQIAGIEMPWANLLVALPLMLLFGEITPKTLAIKNSEKLAEFVARPLNNFMLIMTPLRWIIRNISDRIVAGLVKNVEQHDNLLTEDVIRSLLEDSEKEGVIDSTEREMISNVFDFGDLRAEDVMTPRAYIFSLSVSMPLPEMINAIKSRHISKVPIYKDNPDNILGVLFATDLIGIDSHNNSKGNDIINLLHTPFFIPKNKRVDELFHVMQVKRISVALVLDEYGSVQGLITIEDLLEEIFGEITDEFEKKAVEFEKISDRLFRVRGNLAIDRFNELLKADIPADEFDTIGGFVFSLFAEMPSIKDRKTYDGWHFTIEKIENNRIETLLVRRI